MNSSLGTGPRSRLLLALLGSLLVGYVVAVFVPGVAGMQVTGFQGRFVDGRFEVIRVAPGSPAAAAGMRAGDIIQAADGTPMTRWRAMFENEHGAYLVATNAWRDRTVELRLLRQAGPERLTLAPRPLNGGDYLRYFGPRTVFALFLLSLVMVIVLYGVRESGAFPIAVMFLLTVLWLFAGARFLPAFMPPLIHDVSSYPFVVATVTTVLVLQLGTSTMMLTALVFPQPHAIYRRWPWIWAPIYIVPLVLLALAALASEATALERWSAIYPLRVWLNTAALIISLAFLVTGYRNIRSPTHRERTRWVVGSMVVAVASILGLWNVPLLVAGEPLIPDFDWLLLPFSLVPLTMTLAMVNHRLFGVRGIIRSRVRSLDRRLTREKKLVSTRDKRISDLVDEIRQLKAELRMYSSMEHAGPDRDREDDTRLARLLERFPVLAEIRRTRLLGASPAWLKVFEQIVIASRSSSPVLIVGESGTGKTDVAFAIYSLSDRNGGIYRELSCSQFEHADPAFALGRLFGIGPGHGLPNVPREGQQGLLQDCDGGTLFLDDFDCLPRNVQDLLLYPLEDRPFEPGVGRGPAVSVSVRFILAINQDPAELSRRGALRPDLLSRLGVRVDIPALRERREDIPLLADHFLAESAAEFSHEMTFITARALNILSGMDFADGNVRALRREIRRAVGRAMLENDTILRAGYLTDAYEEPASTPAAAERDHQRKRIVGAVRDETSPGETDQESERYSHHLEVLRRHRFLVSKAEVELGYSHKSRTLSNHLRGICIRAMVENNWDLEAAARDVAGTDDEELVRKILGKIRRFERNIRDGVGEGQVKRLYNNLPAAYRAFLDAALARWEEAD